MRFGERSTANDCPESNRWLRMAVGMSSPHESDELLGHAAGCAACASRLRDLLEGVNEDDQISDATQTDVSRLAIQSGKMRKKLASRMAGNKLQSKPYWVAAAAMFLVCLGLGAWYIKVSRNAPPLELLAAAYTTNRTMELEIPGAAFAPLNGERGDISINKMPSGLLEGQLLIQRHLEGHPEDPGWLHAQGLAHLLVWQFDEALKSFQTAADLGENSPDFLVDYATGYYQRAERNSTALDYARALEKLGLALRQRPNDATALFNRGVIYGKLHQYDSAIADLQQCLILEKRTGWRTEAQRRLDELRAKRSRLLDSKDGQSSDHQQAELALETAMVSGLMLHFHNGNAHLETLAAGLIGQHHDPWLREVIQLPRRPDLERAVDILSIMTRLRTVSDNDYSRHSAEINWLENAPLPKPLRIWRSYELLYRDTRTQAVTSCSDTTRIITSSRAYPWFATQSLLESSLCDVGREDFVGAANKIDEAENIAQKFGLAATLIRIPNFRGQRLVETGFFQEAIQTATDALDRIEGGGYPLRRAYDFHAIVVLAATQINLPATGYGASSMMVSIADRVRSPLWQMIGHCRRAAFALALGRDGDADDGFRSAEKLFQGMRTLPAARPYWRSAQVRWLEAHRDRETLYRMLQEARQEAATSKNTLYFDRNLTAALCRLEARDGRAAEVETLGEEFWRDSAQTPASSQTGIRAFRPELESVSQSIVSARLTAGRIEEALEAWQRFTQFDERLLGGSNALGSWRISERDVAVLTIAPLRGGSAGLWLRLNEKCDFHWAPAGYFDLVSRVRRLRRLCSLSSVPPHIAISEARKLYEILFPKGTGAASHVYLEVREELNAVPLTTFLPQGKGNGPSFSFLPFGRVDSGGPAGDGIVNKRMTIVAPTHFNPKLGLLELPGVEQEIGGVRNYFRAPVVLRGNDANSRALEKAAMTSQIVHFTGHAIPWHGRIGLVVEPDSSDPSADGRMGIWTMERPRHIKSELLVFSACKTGVYEETATVQSGQLPVAALLAGAKQVVATLWDVDSSASSAWANAFYFRMLEGNPVAEAVRIASQDVRSIARWNHPRYWAAFVLYEQ
jgi:tetratricopeptide (TPR) repeat protein